MQNTEILQPFQLTPSGQVAVTSAPSQQGQQHINMIITTNPGERVMLDGSYGVGAASLVFEPDDGFLADQIVTATESQMAQWEPSIIVNSVVPVADYPSEGSVTVDVQWSLPASSALSPTNTATVLVGGTVVEDVQ
jgi:phage baseplate assembly protein W